MDTEDAVLTLKEVAGLYRKNVRTLYRMKRAGTLPFAPVPGFVDRYSRERVLAIINGHRR